MHSEVDHESAHSLRQKLSLLFRRNQFRSELDEEMAFHRAQMEQELLRRRHVGGSRAPWRRSTIWKHGQRARTEPGSRRLSLRRPCFRTCATRCANCAITPVLHARPSVILALGMGVSVAIFGFVDAALDSASAILRAQPPDVRRRASANFLRSNLSRDDYDDWKRLNHSFSSLEVYGGTGYLLHTSVGDRAGSAARVSAGFFSTLGTRMMLGRGFLSWRRPARRSENCRADLRRHG